MFVKIASDQANTNVYQTFSISSFQFNFISISIFVFLFIILHVREEQSNFYHEGTFLKSFLKSECLFFSNSEQSGWNHVLKNLNSFSNMNHMNFCEKETKKRGLLLLLLLKLKKNVLSKQFWTRFYGPGAHFARSDIGKLCAKMHQLDFADH